MPKVLIGLTLKLGWQSAKQHFWFFVRMLLFVFIMQMAFGSLTGYAENSAPRLVAVVALASIVIHTIVNMGIIYSLIRIIKGAPPRFSDIFRTVHPFWRYLGASVVYAIVVGVGLVLLVIPGLVLAVSLQFYSYLILDQDLGLFQSLWRSWEITRGARAKLILLAISLVAINLVGALLLGIGLLWTIPMSLAAIAHVYKALADNSSGMPITTIPLRANEGGLKLSDAPLS